MFTTDDSTVPVAFLVQCHVADSTHLTGRYKKVQCENVFSQ